MTQLATQLKQLGIQTPPEVLTPPVTPEQKLLQAILATTISECRSYRKTGKISYCCSRESKTLYGDNIRTLKLIDTQYLTAAGFRHQRPVLAIVRKTVNTFAGRSRSK